jgi:predicted unusual protein kinase regulating ubiquinone biosynthesis (AarF/ABC1/UbiB family)
MSDRRFESKPAAVPSSRLSRLSRLGGLATSIAGTVAADAARRFSRGERPRLEDLLPTPANARKLADERARMRGAAMKVGQLFEFRLMQTDPNFANYRYAPATGRIVLLDFGATRAFPDNFVALYRRLLRAGVEGDRAGLRAAAREIGFPAPDAPEGHPVPATQVRRHLSAGDAHARASPCAT